MNEREKEWNKRELFFPQVIKKKNDWKEGKMDFWLRMCVCLCLCEQDFFFLFQSITLLLISKSIFFFFSFRNDRLNSGYGFNDPLVISML